MSRPPWGVPQGMREVRSGLPERRPLRFFRLSAESFGGEFRRRVLAESFGRGRERERVSGRCFLERAASGRCSGATPRRRPECSSSLRPGAARPECHPLFLRSGAAPWLARVTPSLRSGAAPWLARVTPSLRSGATPWPGPSNPLSPPRSGAAARAGKEKFADSKGFAIFAHNSLKSVYDYGKFERPEEGD